MVNTKVGAFLSLLAMVCVIALAGWGFHNRNAENTVKATTPTIDGAAQRAAERIKTQGYNHVNVVNNKASTAEAGSAAGMVIQLDENGNIITEGPIRQPVVTSQKAKAATAPVFKTVVDPDPSKGVHLIVPPEMMPYSRATIEPDGQTKVECIDPIKKHNHDDEKVEK
jgi:hypothetical protein